MGEINSSIEKMSLTATTSDATTTTTTTATTERRDSDWTEGYGSMSSKSDPMSSRCQFHKHFTHVTYNNGIISCTILPLYAGLLTCIVFQNALAYTAAAK
jgi:hypothetical protein